MWLRNQDGTQLVEAKLIYVTGKTIYTGAKIGAIAEYKSRERAQEVMINIEDSLIKGTRVFRMPKE